ncbi:Hypothetical protein POVN_LOCUS40 [uncultured virus]|nr:Hypothetical protein POVN_LOCUS40 [uncultured virus]
MTDTGAVDEQTLEFELQVKEAKERVVGDTERLKKCNAERDATKGALIKALTTLELKVDYSDMPSFTGLQVLIVNRLKPYMEEKRVLETIDLITKVIVVVRRLVHLYGFYELTHFLMGKEPSVTAKFKDAYTKVSTATDAPTLEAYPNEDVGALYWVALAVLNSELHAPTDTAKDLLATVLTTTKASPGTPPECLGTPSTGVARASQLEAEWLNAATQRRDSKITLERINIMRKALNDAKLNLWLYHLSTLGSGIIQRRMDKDARLVKRAA